MLVQRNGKEEKKEIETVFDLISYYKDIFTILSSCAAKQIEEVTFRREVIEAKDLSVYATNYLILRIPVGRRHRKNSICCSTLTSRGCVAKTKAP